MEETEESGTTQEDFVNYMPGMPSLSNSQGSVERFVQSVFQRRGSLRAVVRRDEPVAVAESDA